MHTQEAFTIKKYVDREALESSTSHGILFIHISAYTIKLVFASKKQDAIFGMEILEVKDSLFKKSAIEINELISSTEIIKTEYSAIKIIIENNCHALIPEALFVAEKADSFLKLNTSLHKRQHVLFNRLSKNMVSVFAITEQLFNSIKSIFPQSEIIHETELMLELMYANYHKDQKDTLFVHVHHSFIEIAHLKNNELNFLNTFTIEGDTDIIYFILSVAELLKLSQEKLRVNIFGNISSTGSLIGLMKKYISNVEMMKRPSQFSFPASFREFQEQQHYIQVNSLLCAL